MSIDIIKDNGSKRAKERNWRCPARAIADTDYANDITILANTPNQAKTQLHGLKQGAGGIGLHVNADKTEYICFNQRGDISTVNGSSLKLMDKFTYLGSSVLSTENNVNTRLAKAWTAIKLSHIQGNRCRESYLSVFWEVGK